LTDADLLGRFADDRDEAAFEALVWRHGPLVYGVCRRILGHAQDAEDAFQASFLILARKAGAVRGRAAVGPWVYRVAQRVALRARSRMRPIEPLPDGLRGCDTRDAAQDAELRHIVAEEIKRLPSRYRTAVVLRYLEGRSTAEAAAALGCPPGTVLSRLAWARRRLRDRLTARGAALPAALSAMAVDEAAGAVPAGWITATAGAALAYAAGGRTGRPAVLAAEVLRAMWTTRLRVGAVVLFGTLAAGAGLLAPGLSSGRDEPKPKAGPAAVDVTVMRPARDTAGESLDFTGRTEASATVDIRSRITGQIVKVGFQPGAKVNRGDLLFELDPRAYQADCDRARAEVQRAEGHLVQFRTDLERTQRLVGSGNVNSEDLSRAKGHVDEAQAGVLVARAGLERTRLDLDATRITSPIDGQTGGMVVGVGNLASPTATLVTIVATDPIHVDFNLDERSILRLRTLPQREVAVQVGLAGDNGFPRRGKVVSVDNRADPATGTVRVRASMPNPGGEILPGMFARVRLMVGVAREELLVPKSAVRSMNDNKQTFALVVGADNAIEWRPVTVGGQRPGDRRVITDGLRPDDRVIVGYEVPPVGAPLRVREFDPKKRPAAP
jgi:RND family efflux transporter MFP subunit